MNNKFMQVMANAQRLMVDDNFNRLVEQKAGNKRAGGINEPNFSSLESQVFGYNSANESAPIQMIQVPQQNNENRLNKLPAAIRESFEKQPPLSGDGIDNTPMGNMTAQLSLNEVHTIPTQPQYNSAPSMMPQGSIDYSLIKSIIDESVARHMADMKAQMLNESTIKGIRMAGGNKIQMLDKAGNLYEAVLTLKKKATN